VSELRATARIRRIQTITLILLVTAGAVNYVDRATLSVANPLIHDELHFSIAEMGLLLSAFLWAYAFAQLPAGALADKVGSRSGQTPRVQRTHRMANQDGRRAKRGDRVAEI